MKFVIMTDSACDLPLEYIREYQIEIFPFTIQMKETTYLDGIDITTPQLTKP